MLKKLIVLFACTAGLTSPASAAAAGFSMTTSQTLLPAFSVGQADYVTGCIGGKVTVKASVPRGTLATVDGRRLKAGQNSTTVAVGPGQRFDVAAGTARYSVRCIPSGFPVGIATGALPKSVPFLAINSIALTSTTAPYAVVVDAHGAPVWWRRAPLGNNTANVVPMATGTIGFWHGDLVNGEATTNGVFEQFGLNGVSIKQYRAVGGITDIHEAEFPSTGGTKLISVVVRRNVNLTSLGGPANASIYDNVMQELDSTGNVVWSWSAADHIPVSWASRWYPVLRASSGTGPIDLFHMNSIDTAADGSVILSFRHLDSVLKVRRSDGAILWKLGGVTAAQTLTVRADSYPQGSTFGGQHDARLLADGTVTVFDNGSNSSGSAYRNRTPRVTRWRIDPTAKTATLVEQFRDPTIPSAFAGGGARRLADGSWVVSWSHQPWIRAYSPSHSLVFGLRNSAGRASYRAVPVSGVGFSRTAFIAGMDAQYPR